LEPFQLAEDAILDIEAIWLYLLEREGLETADRITTEIFKGFYCLAERPGALVTAGPISPAGWYVLPNLLVPDRVSARRRALGHPWGAAR
jgi:hypothetical protein